LSGTREDDLSATVVVGCQWGDEGKGKIVDMLSGQTDMVVRYQGGDNAGHTVIHGGQTFRLHLIPSGILYPGVLCVLADGIVVNPRVMLEEMAGLRDKDVDLSDLRISANSHLIMPYHITLDRAREERLGKGQIGTTCRGIGPAYADKAARSGIRADALLNNDVLEQAIRTALEEKNLLLEKVYNHPPLRVEPIIENYAEYGRLLRDHIADTSRIIYDAITDGKRVLFESAQGALLDINHGTYPYVTSSSPLSANACVSAGIGPTAISTIIGVVKAYQTRVGAGPFPTELFDDVGERLTRVGHEFGTTTGRRRRCGWLDGVALKYTARLNGVTEWALTKLDVLSSLETIKVCVAYQVGNEKLEHFPMTPAQLSHSKPIFEELPGWDEPLDEVRRHEDLPSAARDYVKFIEQWTGIPVTYISVGPSRDQIVLRER
jgi:adenylosuccinate synthase